MSADFTLYLDGATILLRAENPTARKHLEENIAEYAQWLVRFIRHDGSTFLLRKVNTDAFFVKPSCVLAALADTLVKRGFTVVKDDKVRPPFARLIPNNGSEGPWLLHVSNYIMPPKVARMILKGAGSPN
jgi:hypothetical protein